MTRAVTYASLLGLAVGLASSGARAEPPIRIDAGLTGSWAGVNERNGTGMVVEIKGYANEALAIGGRVEIAMFFGGSVGSDNAELGFAMIGAGLLKAEYYVLPGQIRPFVSAGAGVYSLGTQIVTGGSGTTRSEAGRYFGIAPQVGLDVGRLRFAATYNAIVGAGFDVTSMASGTRQTDRVSSNYFSLELSFRFGGGPKPPPPQQPSYPAPQYPPPQYPQPQYPPQPQ
jgi:hypothetical protein